eukprot:jgi/Picsp_1/306/NSC_00305-R1_protein
MSMLGLIQRAEELRYVKEIETKYLMDRLEQLVAEGRVPSAEALTHASGNKQQQVVGMGGMAGRAVSQVVEVRRSKDIPVFEYVKGVTPVPRKGVRADVHGAGLGTKIGLGRNKWVSDGVSIFSVADGKKLAGTETKALNHYENIRMMKIQKAALETPTVLGGLRVLPECTPGRALMWGTVLALWGTGAIVASTAKYLDIQNASQAPEKIKLALSPIGLWLEGLFVPWRTELTRSEQAAVGQSSRGGWVTDFTSKLRDQLVRT